MTTPEPVHTESEAHPWQVQIPNHPSRQDSPEYVASRTRMNDMASQSAGLIYGSGPYEDHHGGSLWLKDARGWFMVRNLAGIEWSAQFCADPAKVDLLRQNAQRLYALIAPEIAQELDPGGLLGTPIADAAGVAQWTDSIFNAGVPLHPGFHTGVLPGPGTGAGGTGAGGTGGSAGAAGAGVADGGAAAAGGATGSAGAEGATAGAADVHAAAGAGGIAGAADVQPAAGVTGAADVQPAAGVTGAADVQPAAGVTGAAGASAAAGPADPEPGGVHHYPTPIADIQLFKYDDFQLWVTDAQGNPAAVAPVGVRGGGDASVHVLYATPGSELARRAAQAQHDQVPLILGPEHPISRQAYVRQRPAGPATAGRE